MGRRLDRVQRSEEKEMTPQELYEYKLSELKREAKWDWFWFTAARCFGRKCIGRDPGNDTVVTGYLFRGNIYIKD